MFRLIGVSVLGGALAGCAPPAPPPIVAPAVQPPAQLGHDVPSVSPAAPPDRDTAPPSKPEVVPAADAVDPDGGPCEQADLDGLNGIHVHICWRRLTGTTHVAEELAITTAGGTLRYAPPAPQTTNQDHDEAPPEYPLMEKILAVAPKRWVLLGWSSLGEGMQTEHAWLIEDRHGPHLLDSLAWTTDRSHAGIAVESSGNQVYLGIPLPQPLNEDGEPGLHNEGDWELVHDKQRLSLLDVRRLPSSEKHVMALGGYYDPPFQVEPSQRHWEGRFVWFSSGTKFALVPHR